jgi:ribonuclease D
VIDAARIVSAQGELLELARALASAPRIGLDLESDGMFAYRPRTCTVQLASADLIAIVDAIATPLDPLGALFGEGGPVKVIHDVAFDARMLAEAGIALGHVHDTAIAARMLGRAATGLASLAKSELGIAIDKSLQQHDWRERPITKAQLDYLARDVAHLGALDDVLWGEVVARGIEDEVIEETRYRIKGAIAAARETDRAPGYGFAKGFEKLEAASRAALRRLWEVREREAAQLDVPIAKLIPTDLLVAIARQRPADEGRLAEMRLPPRVRPLATVLVAAVRRGEEDGDAPAEDLARFEPPRPSREAITLRRTREKGLTAWRKAEAAARGVDEQVVLPGHCVKDLAESKGMEVEDVTAVAGFGACRARYAPTIAEVLRRASAGMASGGAGEEGSGESE